MIDWKRPFDWDRAVCVLLFFVLVGYGVLIGLAISLFSQDWWKVVVPVSATFGGAFAIAKYVEDRKDRREYIKPVNEVLEQLETMEPALRIVCNFIGISARRHQRNEDYEFSKIDKELQSLIERNGTARIPAILPTAYQRRLQSFRRRFDAYLIGAQSYVDRAVVTPKGSTADEWRFAEQRVNEAHIQLAGIRAWLLKMIA